MRYVWGVKVSHAAETYKEPFSGVRELCITFGGAGSAAHCPYKTEGSSRMAQEQGKNWGLTPRGPQLM